MPAGMRATGLLQNKVPENQVKKEVAENLRLEDFQQLFGEANSLFGLKAVFCNWPMECTNL